MSLRILKWAQIVLAALVTGFFVLLLPGAGAIFLPAGILYIVWAIRARSDHRYSAWLALLCTLFLAVVVGHDALHRIAGLLSGEVVARDEFAIFVTMAVLAAAIVVLHGINWRWLIAPAPATKR